MTQTIRNRNPQQTRPLSSDPLVILGICFALGAVTFGLFSPTAFYVDPNKPHFLYTMGYEFINCDDDPYVSGNPYVQRGFCLDNLIWCMTTGHAANWHPLTWASHVLDCELYGPVMGRQTPAWAGGHHLTSVLIHTASVMALFLALWLMTGAPWRSAIVAAMFAVHPLRVESVAWIAERKDVLCGFFWMLTMLAYAYYALRPCLGRYIAVAVCFALGLMSKSMVVTLPCVFLLLDFWPLHRLRIPWLKEEDDENKPRPGQPVEPPRFPMQTLEKLLKDQFPGLAAPENAWMVNPLWLVLEKLPLLAMSAGVCMIVMYYQHSTGAMDMSIKFPFIYHLANAACATVAYIWMMIYPVNLAIFYPHPAILNLHNPEGLHKLVLHGLGAMVILAAITAFVLWKIRRHGYLAVGWFWYLGVLVPVLGLVQVGVQSMADRYTYLPMIGVDILLVWGVAELVAKSRELRIAASVGVVALLVLWSYLTTQQVATWQNSYTVFKHATDVVPNCFFGYNHLGLYFHTRGQQGNNKDKDEDAEKAGEYFKKSVAITPYYDSSNGNLGVYYMNRKKFPEAIKSFEAAVGLNPYLSSHHANLAAAYLNSGRYDEAIERYKKAIAIQPEVPTYHFAMSMCYMRKQQIAETVKEIQEGLKFAPGEYEMQLQLAWILATSDDPKVRDGREAEMIIMRMIHQTRLQNARMLGILAAAFAQQGRFPEAVETAQKALEMAKQQKNEVLIKQLQELIPQYEQKRALRIGRY